VKGLRMKKALPGEWRGKKTSWLELTMLPIGNAKKKMTVDEIPLKKKAEGGTARSPCKNDPRTPA